MYMRCKLSNKIMEEMRSLINIEQAVVDSEVMDEEEDMVEEEVNLYVTTVDNLDTTQGTVQIRPLHVSIVNHLTLHPGPHCEVVACLGRRGSRVGRQEDENPVGQLQ